MKNRDYIKNCHFCLHVRPKRNDLCSVHRIFIADIHSHTCSEFKLDECMVRILAEEVKSEDEGESCYLTFNLPSQVH